MRQGRKEPQGEKKQLFQGCVRHNLGPKHPVIASSRVTEGPKLTAGPRIMLILTRAQPKRGHQARGRCTTGLTSWLAGRDVIVVLYRFPPRRPETRRVAQPSMWENRACGGLARGQSAVGVALLGVTKMSRSARGKRVCLSAAYHFGERPFPPSSPEGREGAR
jgi:hypothetical protein